MSHKLSVREKAIRRRLRLNRTLLDYSTFVKKIRICSLVAIDRINEELPPGKRPSKAIRLLRETAKYAEFIQAEIEPKLNKALGIR